MLVSSNPPLSPAPGARVDQSVPQAAAGVPPPRAETRQAVAPPPPSPESGRIAGRPAPEGPLFPPDPDPPTGPPPAFDATPLEQSQRSARDAEIRALVRRVMTEAAPEQVPPPPADRAKSGITELRSLPPAPDTRSET